ncbi:hypothetical protein SH139x_005792 [Planctomycetaceae bacterium SH139]
MFDFLELTRPTFGKAATRSVANRLRVQLSTQVALPLPLIAYDLPWCERPPEVARYVADNLDGLGVSVAGLQSEFHHTDDEQADSPSPLQLTICPYRAERFGLHFDDLANARIIDIRLTLPRQVQTGLPRYSANTMRRWDQRAARMADRAMQAFGDLDALCWPPDVAEVGKLGGKVEQLRALNPTALVAVSIEAYRAATDLARILPAKPDLICLRADRWPADQAVAFLQVVAATADRLQQVESSAVKLAVIPPPDTDEQDIVKLLALGADLVAIDHWCRDLITPAKRRQSSAEWAAANLGVVTTAADQQTADIDLTLLVQRIAKTQQWIEAAGAGGVAELNRKFLVNYTGSALPGVAGVN